MPHITDERGLFLKDVQERLEQGFKMGFSNAQACHWAGIGEATFYNVTRDHPDLQERFEKLKENPKLKAVANIVNSIDKGDINDSKWYLERKAKAEFAPRTELTGPEGTPLGYVYSSDVPKEEEPEQLPEEHAQ